MRVIKDINDISEDLNDSFITIGNFDGIHLGHQSIFRKLVGESKQISRKSIVMTFDPHPKKIIHPERRPFFLLTQLDEKLKIIESFGIDAAIVITFSEEFSRLSAEEFVEDILWKRLHVRKVFIGYDYAFGRNAAGNAQFLRTFGTKFGFEVEEIGVFKVDDTIVSSTNIRLSILDGNVGLASKMLGRPYSVSGTVIKGYGRGTKIGYPTANIESEKVIPAIGVYVVVIEMEGNKYEGIINIGRNPTFGNEGISAEVHFLDFRGNIYGRKLEISFIERLRNEIKFESPDMLVGQIKKDIVDARKILAAYHS
jgi:riboflavin kinase/FMN adenylyltransferase